MGSIVKIVKIVKTWYNNQMAEDKNKDTKKGDSISDLSRATSDFLTIVAHKIHTPVGAVTWQLELLLSGDLGPLTKDQKETLEIALQSSQQLNDLSRSLMYVFELEKDLPVMQQKDVSLSEVVQKVIKHLHLLSEEKEVNVVCENNDKELTAFVDPELAFAILRTFIENAIRYSPTKSTVMVNLLEEEGEVAVNVKDSGCGIPGDQRHLVFTKFFRGENAKKIWTEGTGLSLFVAKSCAERTGGKVTCESTENMGSVFSWHIPGHKRAKQAWERGDKPRSPKEPKKKWGLFNR